MISHPFGRQRILYLTHPEADYGEYFLFNGLCQLFGSDNVVTLPLKKSYYGQVDDDYILDDGSKGLTAPGDYITPKWLNKDNNMTYEKIVKNIEEFSFMVLSSPRTHAVNALDRLFKDFNGTPIPLVFTDHEDGDNIRHDIMIRFKPTVIFKREMLSDSNWREDITDRSIYPLPFSSAVDSFPKVDKIKKYDIFASFGATWGLRRDVVERLLEANYPNTYLGIDTTIRGDVQSKNQARLSYKDYITALAQSKIAITVRGHGRDTVRYWEIPGSGETLMFICDPGIVIPNDFEDGKTAVFFKEDLSDLHEKLEFYVSHDREREHIARAGHRHLLKFHTNLRRAEYFMAILQKHGVIKSLKKEEPVGVE